MTTDHWQLCAGVGGMFSGVDPTEKIGNLLGNAVDWLTSINSEVVQAVLGKLCVEHCRSLKEPCERVRRLAGAQASFHNFKRRVQPAYDKVCRSKAHSESPWFCT
jgi:hypothetical protein